MEKVKRILVISVLSFIEGLFLGYVLELFIFVFIKDINDGGFLAWSIFPMFMALCFLISCLRDPEFEFTMYHNCVLHSGYTREKTNDEKYFDGEISRIEWKNGWWDELAQERAKEYAEESGIPFEEALEYEREFLRDARKEAHRLNTPIMRCRKVGTNEEYEFFPTK